MDRTSDDDEMTKSRYGDAYMIQKQKGIPAYPTFFAFSREGKLLSRGSGLKYPEDFLGFVSSAIDTKEYHPYARYYAMLAEYQKRGKGLFKDDVVDWCR